MGFCAGPENTVMRNPIDIDSKHSRAIVREIGKGLRESVKEDQELPANVRMQLERLRQSEGEGRRSQMPVGRSSSKRRDQDTTKLRKNKTAPARGAPGPSSGDSMPGGAAGTDYQSHALREVPSQPGTFGNRHRYFAWAKGERTTPAVLLWAVPAVIFVGGAGYFLVRAMH